MFIISGGGGGPCLVLGGEDYSRFSSYLSLRVPHGSLLVPYWSYSRKLTIPHDFKIYNMLKFHTLKIKQPHLSDKLEPQIWVLEWHPFKRPKAFNNPQRRAN